MGFTAEKKVTETMNNLGASPKIPQREISGVGN